MIDPMVSHGLAGDSKHLTSRSPQMFSVRVPGPSMIVLSESEVGAPSAGPTKRGLP